MGERLRTVEGAMNVYASDFGMTYLSPSVSDAIKGPCSSMPAWFDRIFRPKIYRETIQAEFMEEWLNRVIKRIWEESGDVPPFLKEL